MTELTSLIAKYITRDTHSGSVNRIRQLMEADLEALIDKRETAVLKEALTIVEQKNDVEILNWFDARLSALSDKHSSKEDVDG